MKLGSFVCLFTKILKMISSISLLGIMLLTCLDVLLGLFGHPVLGAEELVSLWAAMLLAFALPIAHIEKANVGVDLLYNLFPERVKRFLDIFNELISFILYALISWRCYLYAITLYRSGEVSMVLELPNYLLVFGISFSLLMVALTIMLGFGSLIKGEDKCQNQ
jgi:C4-dicarboxylate transporter, DctQ subunit